MDRIRQLARKWGTRIRKRHCEELAFNGKTIAEFQDAELTTRRSDSNLIHDIAHFVVAAPERRTMPEFGLGDAPDTHTVGLPRAKGMTAHQAQQEEELTSALGIYWERQLGLNWRKTYQDHSWVGPFMPGPTKEKEIFDITADHKFARMLQELKKRNII